MQLYMSENQLCHGVSEFKNNSLSINTELFWKSFIDLKHATDNNFIYQSKFILVLLFIFSFYVGLLSLLIFNHQSDSNCRKISRLMILTLEVLMTMRMLLKDDSKW